MHSVPEKLPITTPAISGHPLPLEAVALAGLDVAAVGWTLYYGYVLDHSHGSLTGLMLTVLMLLVLIFISVGSLTSSETRSVPWIFRVLLGGTVLITLPLATWVTLVILESR